MSAYLLEGQSRRCPFQLPAGQPAALDPDSRSRRRGMHYKLREKATGE
jgi:hypothetical protein